MVSYIGLRADLIWLEHFMLWWHQYVGILYIQSLKIVFVSLGFARAYHFGNDQVKSLLAVANLYKLSHLRQILLQIYFSKHCYFLTAQQTRWTVAGKFANTPAEMLIQFEANVLDLKRRYDVIVVTLVCSWSVFIHSHIKLVDYEI